MSNKISFAEFRSAGTCTYVWFAGVGCPAGRELHHNVLAEGEDYCDFADLDAGLFAQFDPLEGSINDAGLWCWDGAGKAPRDERGNTIYNLKAGWKKWRVGASKA